MRITSASSAFCVIDDLLPTAAQTAVWEAFHTEPMVHVRRHALNVYGLCDGDPYRGQTTSSGNVRERAGMSSYPSGRAIDRVVEAIRDALPEVTPWSGREGNDWDFFSATPYIYPAGTGLSWHEDTVRQEAGLTDRRTASFILYVHPEWRPNWGGELLVCDSGAAATGADSDPRRRRQDLVDAGIGTYVFPRPNRLVVLRSGLQHTIKKVDASAGDNFRASIAGFFHRVSESQGV